MAYLRFYFHQKDILKNSRNNKVYEIYQLSRKSFKDLSRFPIEIGQSPLTIYG